ncbi:P-loop NTPase [Sphingobacterium multivorum]|uniref:P-loop NTPase n=1 Tax=Sphingobacterium multivorum TaxID=28454 RepID=UPI002896E39F|nr:hypothetical protein [Sphingobacterium multivorum]
MNQTPTLSQLTGNLDRVLEKRNGGAINFKGIHFQILYTAYRILEELKQNSKINSIQMEGIEDIDIHSSSNITVDAEYVQLKSSVNVMDAGTFWTLGVLQNFLEVYKNKANSKFKMVHNMAISKGNLSYIKNRKKGDTIPEFWISKLNTLSQTIDFVDFLDCISFEYRASEDLYKNIQVLLYKEWDINKGAEAQFLNALFYNILIWSKDRATVNQLDIVKLFQSVKDSSSKSPTNKAIQNNWIAPILYEKSDLKLDDYYDGKAARPQHIAMGLPTKRKSWEKLIEETIRKADVAVIRASSGQGKSTLAWQVGFNLSNKYSLYQLHSCRNINEANSVMEFLQSRVIIGEIPLVIIDGLSNAVVFWAEIVDRAYELPIKFIITSRNEDWSRFGGDISRINLIHIDINLSIQEAKEIFDQLKKKNKIHSEIINWQPIWEQVYDKGLLIEYTYLLTKGQMINDRLADQIKYLNNSISASAKIEILRMVSLADCLDIKLETIRLINYIKSVIGFQQDRGLILNELEKEYFLNFDSQYIEGLHPVRSNHLKNLLHHNIPIENSMINLLMILDDNHRHDFFINAPFLLSEEGKSSFYKELANFLSKGEISDIVFAFDGIMHGEPQRYWLTNKDLFDKAFNMGAIQLFTMVTVPFTKLNTLSELSVITGKKNKSFQELDELKAKLPDYTFEDSDLVLFARSLKAELEKRTTPITSYQGLEFLIKWFDELALPLKLPFIQSKITIEDLLNMDVSEAKELMLFMRLSNPTAIKEFIAKNRNSIISYLKFNTNSLIIEEQGEQIKIKYLLFDNEADKANELSVSRIQTIYSFLPFYKKYCTEAILLPFPSEELVSVVKQNSIKHLSPDVIGDKFDVHLNQIWLSIIQKNYHETSAYDWQYNIIEIRKTVLEWTKIITRFIDSLLENNNEKKDKVIPELIEINEKLSNCISSKKSYPKYKKSFFEQERHLSEEKDINNWTSSVSLINNQLLNLFKPKEIHDRNVFLINLNDVYFGLPKMQKAFKKIESKTISYFDSDKICLEEEKCFERLYATIKYYVSQIPLERKKADRIGKLAVEEWWKETKYGKLNSLKSMLTTIQKDSHYRFILPNKLKETSTVTYATFGVEGADFANESEIFQFSLDLCLLSLLEIDYFTVIIVKNGVSLGGVRFKKDYFDAFYKNLLGEDNINLDRLTPIPLGNDLKIISDLPEISLPPPSLKAQDIENRCKVLFELWKLSEHRTLLDKNSEIECNWLHSTEIQTAKSIKKLMTTLNQEYEEFSDFVYEGVDDNRIYTKSDIVNQLFKVSNQKIS